MKFFRREEHQPTVVRTEEDTAEVVLAVMKDRGISLLRTEGDVFRLVGNSSVLDFWMPPSVEIGGTTATLSCILPIPVGEGQLPDLMELCLWLTARSRVRFAVDHARPFGAIDAQLGLLSTLDAQDVVRGSLETLYERMAGYASAFHEIANGGNAESALGHVDIELLNYLRPRPWSNDPPSAARWPSLNEQSMPLPAPDEVREGYTPEEFRATLLLLDQLSGLHEGTGVQRSCAGPIMIHADGVVECFGCSDPATTPHLEGTTIACEWWRQVGRGHVCDRCDPDGQP